MKSAVLMTCLGVCISYYSYAQPDSSKGLLKIHLDMRTTLSEGKRLRMGGASLGWEFGEQRDEITAGYYWTGKRGRKDLNKLQGLHIATLRNEVDFESDLRYFSLGYWKTIRDWPRWKISVPLDAGIGRARFTEEDADFSQTERIRIFPVQAALYGEWKATRWLGVGTHVGYRHYFSAQNHSSLTPISGMYYRIRVLVYMQTFYDWRDFVFRQKPLASPFYQ